MTTSQTRDRIKDLKNFVSRVIQAEEKEALLNDLSEIGEAYQEGWESGSDSEEDD